MFQVGSDYDLKEQVFRNFGRIMGPFSDPGLIHKWGPGSQFSATFVWVDPTNTVAGSYEVKIEAGNQVCHQIFYVCESYFVFTTLVMNKISLKINFNDLFLLLIKCKSIRMFIKQKKLLKYVNSTYNSI